MSVPDTKNGTRYRKAGFQEDYHFHGSAVYLADRIWIYFEQSVPDFEGHQAFL
jgi:hypothetical protein